MSKQVTIIATPRLAQDLAVDARTVRRLCDREGIAGRLLWRGGRQTIHYLVQDVERLVNGCRGEGIARWRVGTRVISASDLASRWDASRATVRRILAREAISRFDLSTRERRGGIQVRHLSRYPESEIDLFLASRTAVPSWIDASQLHIRRKLASLRTLSNIFEMTGGRIHRRLQDANVEPYILGSGRCPLLRYPLDDVQGVLCPDLEPRQVPGR